MVSHTLLYGIWKSRKETTEGIFGQNSFLSFGISKYVSAARIEAFNAEMKTSYLVSCPKKCKEFASLQPRYSSLMKQA
jgi:hypothetical protein